jgi:clan AA aspartic protease
MIHGVVSRNREATISLVIVNESRQTKLITAVIDTGYTGFLSLPSEIITELNLSWTGINRGTLGDGSEVTFEVYAVKVIWDGEYRDIPINEAETEFGYNVCCCCSTGTLDGFGYRLEIASRLFV